MLRSKAVINVENAHEIPVVSEKSDKKKPERKKCEHCNKRKAVNGTLFCRYCIGSLFNEVNPNAR